MSELQILVDDALLERAVNRARRDGTTVEDVLGRFLNEYAENAQSPSQGLRSFIEWAERSESGSPVGGRTWTRDEIHGRKTG